jgi:hypothetical protein
LKKEEFIRYYGTLSNVELLKILEEKKNYQAGALEAAEEILSTRNYNDDDVIEAKTQIDHQLNKKLARSQKINDKTGQVIDFIDENFGIKNRTPAKMLNLFCAGIAVYLLINAILNFRFLASIFENNFAGSLFAVLVYGLEFLFVFLLYNRSNWGWVIFIFSAGLLVTSGIRSLVASFQPSSGFFFMPVNRGAILFSLLLNIAIILFLNNKKITQQFTISKQGRDTTFIILAVVAFLYFFARYIL